MSINYFTSLIITSLMITTTVSNPIKTQGMVDANIQIKYDNGILDCVTNINVNKTMNITWYRDDVEISENDFLKLPSESKQLQITDIEQAYGKYKCKMVDHSGSAYSDTLEIKPNYLELNIINQFENITVADNKTRPLHIKCFVTAYPSANLTFLHNGKVIEASSRIVITKEKKSDDGDLYELTIDNITRKDGGEYHCRATNGLLNERLLAGIITIKNLCLLSNDWVCPNTGKCISKAECKKYEECVKYNCERPAKPNVQIKYIGYDKISLYWPSDENAMEFTIIADTRNSLSQVYRTTQNFIIIDKLKNYTSYWLSIYALNKIGTSADNNIHFTTKRMVSASSIENAKVVPKEETSGKITVTFQWTRPKDDGMENKDGDLEYRIKYCLYNTNHNQSDCQEIITRHTSLDIPNIQHNSLYMFSVRSFNKAGQEGPSKNVYYRTGASNSALVSCAPKEVLFISFVIFILQVFHSFD